MCSRDNKVLGGNVSIILHHSITFCINYVCIASQWAATLKRAIRAQETELIGASAPAAGTEDGWNRLCTMFGEKEKKKELKVQSIDLPLSSDVCYRVFFNRRQTSKSLTVSRP